MKTDFDIHVHDIKKIVVERAFEKPLIRIHLVGEDGRRETVMRIWNATREWPEIETIDERPERIVIASEESDP